MASESVIPVDEEDKMLGTMEKMAVHRLGKLHRAISVFIFNYRGEFLLQRRAYDKYHSAGKWTNTCCSHPRPGEQNIDAAQRRLKEEMGLDCDLTYGYNFLYRADFKNGLSEYEYDHVFFGTTDALPLPNPQEVAEYTYMDSDELQSKLRRFPDDYSEWFKICFEKIVNHTNLKK